ncbi:hypothetical protein DdX_13415 [Ditylenchus destructor]|uniref:Uncharacterized protein n=1 Tax=Ditylenchus destructor TaxID=166010 RepID=A0AAD4MTN6_9BILA|nr:hypothetical protein DdX_13415 [Ditylenchus destructor]
MVPLASARDQSTIKKLVQEEVKAPQHQQQQALVLAYKSCAHYPLHTPLDRPPRWQEYPPPRKGHPTKRSTETRNCQLQTGNNQQPGSTTAASLE